MSICCSIVPYREKSSGTNDINKRPRYSPFDVGVKDNKVDYVLARVDDLVNWGRKVMVYFMLKIILISKSCTMLGTQQLHVWA